MAVNSKDLAFMAAEAAAEKKGKEIVILQMEQVSIITDYFVICTGANTIQVQAIAKEVEEKLGEEGNDPLRKEGYQEGQWILLDYGHIMVHVFLQDEREYYDLERLWRDAKQIPYAADDE